MTIHHPKKAGELSRRGILKGGAALASASVFVPRSIFAQSARPKVTVINGTGTVSQFQTLLLNEFKLFDKYEVDANLLTVADTSKILAALIGGDGDICGGSGFNSLFPAIEKGATIKILAGANAAPTTIIYSTRPEIKSVKDLPGRTVGTGPLGTLLHQLVVAVMQKYGVDYTSVNFVNVGSGADILKALVAGVIDAGVAPVEFRDTAPAKYKIYPLVDGEFYKELPLYVNQAMFASDKVIAEKRQGLIRVMAALADMYRWMSNDANKQAFVSYFRQAVTNASEEDALFIQDFIAKPGRLTTNLVLSEEQLLFNQQLNIEFGSQKATLAFNQCADMSLAQEAVKLIKA